MFMTITGQVADIDPSVLRDALSAANTPTLVPLLVQLTGDQKWTRPPYRPTRAQGTDDHDDGGLPTGIREEIRAAVEEAVLAYGNGRPAAIPAPTGSQLVSLMRLCVAERVPEDYEPMSAETMGFRPVPARSVPAERAAATHVIIVGAGISGLNAAKYLRDLGIRCTVIEKNERVGGTWINNRYPGCGVDTPSFLYSFGYFTRPWSAHFAKRAELDEYLTALASHFGLTESILFKTTVESASWGETTGLWNVAVRQADGERQVLTANVLISAVGQLNVPAVPAVGGIDRFAGPAFHSACWPDGLDITGQRVAVVGTGASAMQIVPAVADRVGHLDIYQRSPSWVSPNANYFRAVDQRTHWLMDHVPFYREWYRFRLSWAFNDRIHASLQKDPDWPHPERSLNRINDSHRRFFTSYLESQLAGRPDLIERALPAYPPFGKRMLLDNGWFAALKRPDVDLITSSVSELTETGIVAADGTERPADIVVFATGFQARRPIHLDIRGRQGRSLADVWGDDDARAYLGITTPGFPNLFFMYGPNTNLGHGGSFINLAEGQATYITDALCQMLNAGIASIECRPEVCDEYNARLDAAHERMVWTHPGMDTWYRNAKGRVVTNMPWRVVDYWTMTRQADLGDFIVRRR
jgi:4-hydroxyacetophenone monooxygenase